MKYEDFDTLVTMNMNQYVQQCERDGRSGSSSEAEYRLLALARASNPISVAASNYFNSLDANEKFAVLSRAVVLLANELSSAADKPEKKKAG